MKTQFGCAVVRSVLLVAAMIACAGPPPTVSNLELLPNTNGSVPLAARVTFTTDKPAMVTILIDDGENGSEVTPRSEYATEHDLPVLGLKPGRTHSLRIAVQDRAGQETVSEPLELTTDPLPEGFPPIEVAISRPTRMEPGISLVPVFKWPGVQPDLEYGLLLALNPQGEVVWYYETDHPIAEAWRLSNGNLVYHQGRAGNLREIDMLGNIVRQWHTTGTPKEVPEESIPVETDTFHHDVVETPRGTFLALSTEVRRFEDYPSSEEDPEAPPKPTNVIGDVLVEFTPDGEKLREWSFFDILDPYRIGYDSLSTGFWEPVYKEVLEEPGVDWTHGNSIDYDGESDTAIVSIYHQSAVVKLDLETGELLWILGEHSGWEEPWRKYLLEPKGDLLWPYYQHAARRTPWGTVLLFDNGNYRARPFEERMPAQESFSRAVEYRVNEEAMEVSQEWTYGGPGDETFFSPFISETQVLPETGNILVTDGGRIRGADGGPSGDIFGGHHWARVVEVTRTTPAEKVWEIVIDDPSMGWAVYRSERLPRLYP